MIKLKFSISFYLACSFIVVLISCKSKDSATYPIFIEKNERFLEAKEIQTNKIIIDTINEEINRIVLRDYFGSCWLTIFDINSSLIMEGNYIGIDSLIPGRSGVENPHNGELEIDTFFYYQPKRHKS